MAPVIVILLLMIPVPQVHVAVPESPVIIMVCPAIYPVPTEDKFPFTVILLVARVNAIVFGVDRLRTVVFWDKVIIEAKEPLNVAFVQLGVPLFVSVKVQLPEK